MKLQSYFLLCKGDKVCCLHKCLIGFSLSFAKDLALFSDTTRLPTLWCRLVGAALLCSESSDGHRVHDA